MRGLAGSGILTGKSLSTRRYRQVPAGAVDDAGIGVNVARHLDLNILGVCLGDQPQRHKRNYLLHVSYL